jgi:cytochrome c
MGSRVGGALLMAAASLAAGCALAQTSNDAQSIIRGQALVQRNCSMCHAVGRVGDSPNQQAPHFRDLSERYPVDSLGEALAEGIIVGHPAMPQFRFTAQEVSDIIAYLNSIQAKRHASAGRRGGDS